MALQWNSDKMAYYGVTSEGKRIRVEADEIAESAQDVGVDVADLSRKSVFGGKLSDAEKELLDSDSWASCIGANQNVEYVK